MKTVGGRAPGLRTTAMFLTLCSGTFLFASANDGHPPADSAMTDAAYALLNERATANAKSFYVYKDADSAFNHGLPSGVFGDAERIHVDPAYRENPAAGTVLRIGFDALRNGDFAGLNFEEPKHWGTSPSGKGYDLRGATEIVFEARSPEGVYVRFGVGGTSHMTQPIRLLPGSRYTTIRIPLSSLHLSATDLTDVHVLFSVIAEAQTLPVGGVLFLSNIRFDPPPAARQGALGLPLATQTFGIVGSSPAAAAPVPTDPLLRNLSTVYESSLTMVALLGRGNREDLKSARLIADALDYALHHDNQGDLIPVAKNGSAGLHNAYMAGDIAFLNDASKQKSGMAGEVRLAGFSAGSALCGPSDACVVLDGASAGNNAVAITALLSAYAKFKDIRYRSDAITLGEWIYDNLLDNTGAGFGGYYLGYGDNDPEKKLSRIKLTEDNAKIFAAFTGLAETERQVGDANVAARWTQRAGIARKFVLAMYDPTQGRFSAGTVPTGTAAGRAIRPDGPTKGDDIVNSMDMLTANTAAILSLAASQHKSTTIDWRAPVAHVLDTFARQVTIGTGTFSGFDLYEAQNSQPNGIAWELTAQVVAAMQFVDDIYDDSRFDKQSKFYLEQLRRAQALSLSANGTGLVAVTCEKDEIKDRPAGSTAQVSCNFRPYGSDGQSEILVARYGVELGPSTWLIFAETRDNPLASGFAWAGKKIQSAAMWLLPHQMASVPVYAWAYCILFACAVFIRRVWDHAVEIIPFYVSPALNAPYDGLAVADFLHDGLSAEGIRHLDVRTSGELRIKDFSYEALMSNIRRMLNRVTIVSGEILPCGEGVEYVVRIVHAGHGECWTSRSKEMTGRSLRLVCRRLARRMKTSL